MDQLKPVFTNLKINLPQSGGRYLSGSQKFTVSISASDQLSGLGALRYALVEARSQPLSGGSMIQLRNQFYDYPLEINAQPGREYFLAAAILDAAGNCSDIKYDEPSCSILLRRWWR